MAHSRKRKFGKHPILLGTLLAVALVMAGLAAFSYVQHLEKEQEYTPEELAKAEGKIQVDGQWYRKKRYIKTFLILGIDKAENLTVEGNVNNQQNDFNALMVVDMENRTYTAIYLNRDTMTEVQRLSLEGEPFKGVREQLALAHTYGTGGDDSCRNAADTVSKLLFGAPVDHYAAFYLDSIGVINDAVGGVTVKIDDDFSGVDPSLVQGQTVQLNAKQAELFVRGRKNVADQTNLNRMTRQQAYLSAWQDRAFALAEGDGQFFANLAASLGDNFRTDLSIQQISDLTKYLQEFKELPARQPEGEIVKGDKFLEFYVDDKALMDMVLELFFDRVD